MRFIILSFKSIKQAKKSYGLIAIKIRVRDLRTLTVWENMQDLQAFRNTGVHLKAMKVSQILGTNQAYTWQTDCIPNWEEAIRL